VATHKSIGRLADPVGRREALRKKSKRLPQLRREAKPADDPIDDRGGEAYGARSVSALSHQDALVEAGSTDTGTDTGTDTNTSAIQERLVGKANAPVRGDSQEGVRADSFEGIKGVERDHLSGQASKVPRNARLRKKNGRVKFRLSRHGGRLKMARQKGTQRKNPLFSDLSNARRFVQHCGEDFRYCSEWGKWLAWNKQRWLILPDDKLPMDVAGSVVDGLLDEAVQTSDTELHNWAVQSRSIGHWRAMVAGASSDQEIAIKSDSLDANHWLLNLKNGTLDLKTGELLPHSRENLCTKMASVEYDLDASCPIWLRFLDKVMGGNADLINMLQRIIGYSLTGVITEQALFFFHGGGANGKSTFLRTVQKMLGDYAQPAPRGFLEEDHNDDHATRLAAVNRARLIIGSEVEAGRHIAESLIKDLTGGERIAARRMREDFWYFDPTHKTIMQGNHKPKVKGTDHGFWRRLKLIPWLVTISDVERDPDLHLKLEQELPGILNWALIGCAMWQQDVDGNGTGLRTSLIDKDTELYRKEQYELQHIPELLEEFCHEVLEFDDDLKLSKKALWSKYEEWCDLNQHPVAMQPQVYKFLREEKFLADNVKVQDGR